MVHHFDDKSHFCKLPLFLEGENRTVLIEAVILGLDSYYEVLGPTLLNWLEDSGGRHCPEDLSVLWEKSYRQSYLDNVLILGVESKVEGQSVACLLMEMEQGFE